MVLPRKAQPDARKPVVLLTGFDAFGGDALNPSWLAVHALHGKQIAGHRLAAAQLPTRFGASTDRLSALLREHRPVLVICTGVASGRSAISLERVAINIDDARIPDNAGWQPVDAAVVAGGPAAYFSSLPIKAMLVDVQAAGVAAEVSQTAGTFVCNHVFYGLMHLLATRRSLRNTRGGFVHVPALPGLGVRGMELDQMVLGLRVAVRSALEHYQDIAHSAGAVA